MIEATMLQAFIERLGGPRATAERLGVDRTTVYRWLAGDRTPSLSRLRQLLDICSASDDERLEVLRLAELQSVPPPAASAAEPTTRPAAAPIPRRLRLRRAS